MKRFLKTILPKRMIIFLSISLFLVKRFFKSLFWLVIDLFTSIKNNKVAFICFCGKGYGDNPKFVAEQLLQSDFASSLDLVWIVDDKYSHEIPSPIRKVKVGTVKAIYELATSRVWINNSRTVYGTRKKHGQFYIQLMHGAIPLKKIERDAKKLPLTYTINAKSDSKLIDLMISNCEYWTKKMPFTYWYNGVISQTGIPKNDIFCSQANRERANEKVRTKFSVSRDVIIVLYAPTFRSNSVSGTFTIDLDSVKEHIKKTNKREVVVFVRLHPNVAHYINNFRFKGTGVIDVTSYSDMSELLCAADILITDYSNTMFQMMITHKPVFLYVDDIDEYDRGLYFDINTLPFPAAKNNEELLNKIINFDLINYRKEIDVFCDKIGFREDGHASNRIVEIVERVVNGSYE